VKETIEIKHISTSNVCVFQNHIVIGGEPVSTNYAITNSFSVNGVEWIIRSICPVVSTPNYQQTYNEQLHKEYNDLVLCQADELFNCLAGSKYNKVALGIMNRYGQYGDSPKCGSGYVFDNTIDLYFTIGDCHNFLKPDKEYIPYIKVFYRDWSLG
jgi:hypothetical protein